MFFLKANYTPGYKYGQNTFYGIKHLGIDYIVPTGTKIYAPFDGTITKTIYGAGGGYQTYFRPDRWDVTYRFLHLSKQLILQGSKVKEGDVIALSGNTGSTTTVAHVHFDVFKGTVLPPLVYTNFIDPTNFDWNPMTTTSVKLYRYGVVKPEIIQSGLDYLNTLLPPDFKLITTTSDATGPFGTQPTGVGNQIQVYPVEILALPHTERIVCLVHSIPGVTNPFFNQPDAIQIPTNWYGDSKEVFAEFYLHELLHAYYYLTGQTDKVHGYSGDLHGTPLKYYLLLLIELKPYWSKLSTAQGEPMIIINNTSASGTKFALSSDAKIGFADFPAYQKFTQGRTVINITLPDAEFNKIPQSQAVIKS